MADNNSVIIDKVFKGTNAYQLGAPNPTQAGIAKSMRWINDPLNSEWRMKTFIPNLFALIGTQVVHSKEWTNPLAQFKRTNISNMKAIEEIMARLIKGRTYMQEAQASLLEYNPPEIETAIHTVNRKVQYPITYNPQELENAFLSEQGLSNFFTAVMQVPINSDNRDEYEMMKDLIAKYQDKWGFYMVSVSDHSPEEATKDDIMTLLENIRAYADKLKFYTGLYNAYKMEVFTPKDQLLVMMTPEVKAKMDVQALAAAFNVAFAEIESRIILVDEMPIKDCYALLMDENWFVCGDALLQTTNFFNGATLNTNYWLHHWETLSMSPMMNAIAFMKEAATHVEEVEVTPYELTLQLRSYNPGGNSLRSVWSINDHDTEEVVKSVESQAYLNNSTKMYTENGVVYAPNEIQGGTKLHWNVDPEDADIIQSFDPTDMTIEGMYAILPDTYETSDTHQTTDQNSEHIPGTPVTNTTTTTELSEINLFPATGGQLPASNLKLQMAGISRVTKGASPVDETFAANVTTTGLKLVRANNSTEYLGIGYFETILMNIIGLSTYNPWTSPANMAKIEQFFSIYGTNGTESNSQVVIQIFPKKDITLDGTTIKACVINDANKIIATGKNYARAIKYGTPNIYSELVELDNNAVTIMGNLEPNSYSGTFDSTTYDYYYCPVIIIKITRKQFMNNITNNTESVTNDDVTNNFIYNYYTTIQHNLGKVTPVKVPSGFFFDEFGKLHADGQIADEDYVEGAKYYIEVVGRNTYNSDGVGKYDVSQLKLKLRYFDSKVGAISM